MKEKSVKEFAETNSDKTKELVDRAILTEDSDKSIGPSAKD